jgi:HEAT repeat protein
LPYLIEDLRDRDQDMEEIRFAVFGVLEQLGEDAREAIPDLLIAAKEGYYREQMRAIAILGNLGPTAVPELEALALDKRAYVSDAAKTALKKIRKG